MSPLARAFRRSDGKKGESSTYETRDTLKNKHDEDLFDYYAATQLALIDAATGAITRLGKPAIYESLDPAPDGEHVLVDDDPQAVLLRHHVSTASPHDVEVWDVSAPANISAHTIASLAARRSRSDPRRCRLGPRDFAWRPTEPATLVWAEALDGGDWNAKVPARDKIMLAEGAVHRRRRSRSRAPSSAYAGFDWSEQPRVALLHEYDDNKHWRQTFMVDVDDPQAEAAPAVGPLERRALQGSRRSRSIACCPTARG